MWVKESKCDCQSGNRFDIHFVITLKTKGCERLLQHNLSVFHLWVGSNLQGQNQNSFFHSFSVVLISAVCLLLKNVSVRGRKMAVDKWETFQISWISSQPAEQNKMECLFDLCCQHTPGWSKVIASTFHVLACLIVARVLACCTWPGQTPSIFCGFGCRWSAVTEPEPEKSSDAVHHFPHLFEIDMCVSPHKPKHARGLPLPRTTSKNSNFENFWPKIIFTITKTAQIFWNSTKNLTCEFLLGVAAFVCLQLRVIFACWCTTRSMWGCRCATRSWSIYGD